LYSSFPSAIPGQFDRACRTLTKSLHAKHSSGPSCAPSHFHGTWGVSVPSDIPQNHFDLTSFADWNPGTCLYMIWTCLNQLVNSIIWRGNAIIGAPVWCDISSNSSQGPPSLTLLLPCASIVALYRIVSVKTVTINRAERLRDVYIDFAIGLGLPVPNNCCATGILKGECNSRKDACYRCRSVHPFLRSITIPYFSHYSKYPLLPLTSLNFSFQSSCQMLETRKMKGRLHREATEPCCKFNSIQFGSGKTVPLSSKYIAS